MSSDIYTKVILTIIALGTTVQALLAWPQVRAIWGF